MHQTRVAVCALMGALWTVPVFAQPIPSLTMIEPTEGTSPTFQTTVRLIVNEAAICYRSQLIT